MRFAAHIVMFMVFLLSSIAPVMADEPGAPVRLLQELTGQWVDLQQEIGREQREWEHQRAALRQTLELLERERAGLEMRLTETGRADDRFVRELSELESRLNARERTLRDADRALRRAERALLDTRAVIPSFARTELEGAYHAVERGYRDAARRPAQDRIRTYLAFRSEWERLRQAVTVSRLTLTADDGVRRQFDVLWLGLAQGYAVSRDDAVGGIGRWTGEEWTWEWNPDWAAPIRTAVQVADGQRPPAFINLPVVLP